MGNQASHALTSTSGVRAYGGGEPEAFLRAVLQSVRETVFLVAADGTILFANRGLPHADEERPIGRNVFECFPPAARELARQSIARTTETGDPGQFQAPCESSEEGIGWLLTRVLPLRRGSGETVHCLVISDVTETRRTESVLRETDEKLRLAVQATDMGTWHWDLARGWLTWDEVACRHLGVHEGPETLEGYLALVHPEDRSRVRSIMNDASTSGRFGHCEHRVQRADGSTGWLSIKGMVVSSQSLPERVLGGVFDITDRRRLEEQLLEAQKMEAIGQLTGGVAHNFNNLLTVITPNLELALEAAPAQLRPELLDASEAAQRAAELVRQLMSLSGRRAEAECERVSAHEVVEHVVAICRGTFDSRIQIELEANGVLPELEVHRGEIEQALLNVCLNARDALLECGCPDPRLRVLVFTVPSPEQGRPERVAIRIEDNGAGMAEVTRRRCFEPFFTTKDVGRGTGLGLAASYGIIQEHGGSIVCESAVGSGAAFTVTLPAAPSDRAKALRTRYDQEPQPGREVIFVVDDDELVRRTVHRMLTRAGFVVLSAASGQEALRIAQSGARFDLCLLDLSMPDLDGAVLLHRLRAIRSDVRALCMTGHAAESVPRDGFCGVVGKPVRYATLVGSLRAVLDARKAQPGT